MAERGFDANVSQEYSDANVLKFIFQKLDSIKDVKISNGRFGEGGSWLCERSSEKSPGGKTERRLGGALERRFRGALERLMSD